MNKRILIIVIVFILSFTFGCQKIDNEIILNSLEPTASDNNIYTGEKGEELNIYVPYYCDSPPATDNEIELWEESIFNKFGYNINLIYFNYVEEKNSLFLETDFNGIVYFTDYVACTNLVEKEYIIPINDYLKKTDVNYINFDSGVNYYQNYDGSQYAIPTSYYESYSFRSYNYEMLQKYQLEIPNNYDELLNFAKDLQNNERYFTYYENSFGGMLSSLIDVFLSFGSYPNIRGDFGVSYNPQTNKFEDAFLTQNFKSAILSIKEMRDNGFIKQHLFSPNEEIEISDISMTFRENIPSYSDKLQIYDLGAFYNGTSNSYLINTFPFVSGFGVLKNTTNIEEVLSFVYDGLYKELELREAFEERIYGFNEELKKDESNNQLANFKRTKDTLILIDEADENLFYKVFDKVAFSVKYDYLEVFQNAANIFYNDIFIDDKSYEEAIARYKINIREIDIEEYLEDLNKYIKK